MTILDTIAQRLGYVKAADTYPQMLLATADAERWSVPHSETPDAQASLYQRLSWVAIAVQFIADAAAAQVFNVKRLKGEDSDDIPNHPFEQLLRKPNPLQSRYEFLFGTFAMRALTGNAYWYVNAPGGSASPPVELWLLQTQRIVPVPDGRSFISHYDYDPGDGTSIKVPVDQIVHFRRYHPRNMFIGLSTIEALDLSVKSDLAMQQWNKNFFAEDNAKVPGILAYRDMINDTDWQRMQADIKRQWGGTKRSGPMLLRGSGDAVTWMATALSQKDMEFLAGRQASKEEIFQAFGVPPGLIDKNATEANANAAKAAFAEYTLWPLLESVAQVVTNTLLMRYGENLTGEFDDPRKTDRLVDLQEQAEYAKTHTIDEIRARYYEDDPLGDDRGLMLPAEIGPGTLMKLDDGAIPEPQPVPAALAAAAQGQPPEQPPEEQDNPEQAAQSEPDAGDALMKADLERWRTKSRKRGKLAAFDSEHIPDAVKAVVAVAGFDWLERYDAHKALREPNRVLEEKLRKAIARILSANGKNWVSAIAAHQDVDLEPAMRDLHAELATSLSRAVQDEAFAQAVRIGIDFDVAEINAAALEWARGYTYELVKGIEKTTRKVISGAVQQFISTPGMTNEQLFDLIASAVGDARASVIGITETTRAYSQGTQVYQEMLRDAGITMQRVWNTSADEKVCPICGPLDSKGESVWADQGPPPAHPNCRCWLTLEYVKKR